MEAQLDTICTLHGPSADAHALHPTAPAWAPTLAALDVGATGGPRTWVGTWVTRASARSLPEILERIAKPPVAGWLLAWPPDTSDWDEHVPPLRGRFGVLAPHALRAAAEARRRGLSVALWGFARCVLGPYAPLAVVHTRAAEHYSARCHGCAVRSRCPGPGSAYVRRFGDAEVRPPTDGDDGTGARTGDSAAAPWARVIDALVGAASSEASP